MDGFWLYGLLGACAGVLSGLFGIGGGIILVPFLAWIFARGDFPAPAVMIMAVATSLATIVVTSLSSVYAHHRLGAVHWPTVFRLAPGVAIGSMVGAWIAKTLPGDELKTLFGLFLVIVALQMGLRLKPKAAHWSLSGPLMAAAGGFIGMLSAMLGIGGGTLTVPLLVKCDFPMRNAVAASAACGLPIAVAGSLSYALLGWHAEKLPAWSAGYVYLPAFFGIIAASILFAPVGARLAHKLPGDGLKRIFAVVLLLVGVKLVF